jgi:PPOX class probable F420-dependent enzyme
MTSEVDDGAVAGLSDRARAMLGAARVGHLATAGADGEPHVVPVCFAVADEVVYSVIDEKPKRTQRLRRVRNVEERGRAALVVDHYEEEWSRLGWVMLRGAATVLEPGEEHGRALELLRARYPQYRAMALEDAPVLRLAVERANEWWGGESPGSGSG